MKEYIQDESKWDGLLKQMQQIVVQSLKSMCDVCEGRDKSFELYGYDFMVDSQIRPWLIEVSTTPTQQEAPYVWLRGWCTR